MDLGKLKRSLLFCGRIVELSNDLKVVKKM